MDSITLKMNSHNLEKRSLQNDNTRKPSYSTCSKFTFILGTAALSATAIALYAIYGSKEKENTSLTTQGGVVESLTLFGSGMLLAGQALLTNAAAQMRMPSFNSQNDYSDSIARIREREFEYLSSVSPLVVSEYDDDDTNSVSSDDDDFFDAIEEQQNPWKRSSSSERALMIPMTDEYSIGYGTRQLPTTTTAAQYDSQALDSENIIYGFQFYWYVGQLRNQTGEYVYPEIQINVGTVNPHVTRYNANFIQTMQITQAGLENRISSGVYDPTGKGIADLSFTESNGVNHRPIAHQLVSGNILIALAQNSYLGVRVYDPTFVVMGNTNYYTAYPSSLNVALGSFADSSSILLFVQNLGVDNVIGKYLDSKGLNIGNSFVLGPCSTHKAVNIANDLVFVTCLNSAGLQGFGINQSQKKIIPQFTICSTPAGGDASHDLAASIDGKRIISHYITNTNDAYFKIYDENGIQLGSEIKSNIGSGVALPLATIAPNGNFIASFARNLVPISRTFLVNNTNPILGPLPSTNLTIGEPYTAQLSATDAEGDPLTFSSSNLPNSATLTPQGLFKWTAVSGQQGLHKISFSVSDGYGGSDSGASISNVLNRLPVPSSISPRNFTANVPLTFRLPFTDPDGDSVICKAAIGSESLPLWVSCVSEENACYLTGTPQLQDVGPFPVNFTGNDPYGGFSSIIGDFHIVSPTERSSSVNYSQSSLITLIAGIVGISGTILGFVYKARQQQIDNWCKKHIKPCYIAADQKARACMRHVLCLGKTTSDRTVPLINSNESDA